MNRISLYDTTLRDGSQTPGAGMAPVQKLEAAKRLGEMGVDVIETGFPYASKTDFEATTLIAKHFAAAAAGPVIAAFAILRDKTVDAAWDAVKLAGKRRIHLGIGTSDVHLDQKMRATREQMLDRIGAAIRHAATYDWEVQFFAEDAPRSDPAFLCEVLSVAIEAGARFLEISDTVGFCTPSGYGALIKEIVENVRNISKAVIGTHTHNDFGLAVANTLAGLENGARQVGSSMNGLGERAGNADTGTLALLFREHPEIGFITGVKPELIFPTARFISDATGIRIPQNQPLVGKNAFRTGTGLHQNGFLKDLSRNPRPKRFSYSAYDPRDYGLEFSFVYNYLSGSKGLAFRLNELGYVNLDDETRKKFYEEFIKIANLNENLCREDLPESVFRQIAEKLMLKINKL